MSYSSSGKTSITARQDQTVQTNTRSSALVGIGCSRLGFVKRSCKVSGFSYLLTDIVCFWLFSFLRIIIFFVFRHGLSKSEENIVRDSEFCFLDIWKTFQTGEE